MKPTEESKAIAEKRLRMAQDLLEFLRQHPLRKDPGDDLADAEVLMLAQIAVAGIRNSLAMLGVET